MSKPHQQLAPCQVSPDCLECPLELCKHDGAAGQAEYDRWRMRDSRERTRELVEAGATAQEIALETGVTLRTAYRRRAKLRV